MISIRSGKGIGDNLYLQSIARHLLSKGKALEVCTHYPDVFRPIADRIRLSPWRRELIDMVAHYIERKDKAGTDQFVDCCIRCDLSDPVDLRLDWTPSNAALIERIGRSERPVIVVQMPREPMGRSDGYGLDLLPDCRTIQRIIDHIGDRATFVQVGAGAPLFRLRGLHVDLANQTSVPDLIDVASVADGALGYCSFIVPLAESLRKPALLVWSRRGLRSPERFIRQITPNKIIHRPETTAVVMDDCDDEELHRVADALLEQAGSGRTVRGQDGGDRRIGAGMCGQSAGLC